MIGKMNGMDGWRWDENEWDEDEDEEKVKEKWLKKLPYW